MGWNSWEYYECNVNETVIMAAADTLVESGLADLGYIYVNVDDCWAGWRNGEGVIQADNATFPSGMQALAAYVHSKGLKFGLYSDAGTETCAGRPGSLGYEEIDANTYASWKVDYLKYDNCNAPEDMPPQERYPIMRDALNATGSEILFSMCEWGVNQPWFWASQVGNSWRTDMDIDDNWESFIRVLDDNIGLSIFSGPGGWNDPDMLEAGNSGMLFVEQRSQFALWCLLKAPLLISTNPQMSEQTLSIVGSKELIAVNQDPLGAQGDVIWQVGYVQIWAGPLADGSRVFILFNRGTLHHYNTTITIEFADLGFPLGTTGVIRNLYAQQDAGTFTDNFSISVQPHDVFAGRFIPDRATRKSYADWRPRYA